MPKNGIGANGKLDNRLFINIKVADGMRWISTQSMPINEVIPTVKLLAMVIVLLLISAVKPRIAIHLNNVCIYTLVAAPVAPSD